MEWIIEFTQIKPGSKLNLYNTYLGRTPRIPEDSTCMDVRLELQLKFEMFISKYAQNVGP